MNLNSFLLQYPLLIASGLLVGTSCCCFWLAQWQKRNLLFSSQLTLCKLVNEDFGSQEIILKSAGEKIKFPGRNVSSMEKVLLKSFISKRETLLRRLLQAGMPGMRALKVYYCLKLLFCLVGGLLAYFGQFGLSLIYPVVWASIMDIVSFSFVFSLFPFFLLGYLVRKRKDALEADVPDFLDLLVLCVGSGLTLEASLRKTVETISSLSPALADEMKTFLSELQILPDKSVAFSNLQNRTSSEGLKYLFLALRQSEIYGTSILSTLRTVAKEHRKSRLLSLENRAAHLPVLLSFPLIICLLPPVIAISAGPGFIIMLRSFGS